MTALAAVLFDMDGTVCDSEPAWMASERAIAKRYGGEWTTADALHLVGFDLLDAGTYIKERLGLPQPAAEVVTELIDGVTASVAREGVDWRPGALDLVEECNDAGIPTALVTMSYRNFAAAVVSAMPRGRFDAVVTGDEVARGKPSPDPYLEAARQLGVAAHDCVAIEDSPTGAASALAAGTRVIVVPNHVQFTLDDRMVERSTLDGVTVADLKAVLAAR